MIGCGPIVIYFLNPGFPIFVDAETRLFETSRQTKIGQPGSWREGVEGDDQTPWMFDGRRFPPTGSGEQRPNVWSRVYNPRQQLQGVNEFPTKYTDTRRQRQLESQPEILEQGVASCSQILV
jgi:hypothetical protein